jgi:adenylate cyclase class IV
LGRNIEIKARASDFVAQRVRAAELSGRPPEMLRQEDTFFGTRRGRLKLRSLGGGRGELIYYEREDREGPTESRYMILPTHEAPALRAALSQALGVSGTVRKEREVYLVEGTRIHFDSVQRLGEFIELEAVLAPGESADDGHARVSELLEALGISSEDLVDRAYIDLLLEGAGEGSDT